MHFIMKKTAGYLFLAGEECLIGWAYFSGSTLSQDAPPLRERETERENSFISKENCGNYYLHPH